MNGLPGYFSFFFIGWGYLNGINFHTDVYLILCFYDSSADLTIKILIDIIEIIICLYVADDRDNKYDKERIIS